MEQVNDTGHENESSNDNEIDLELDLQSDDIEFYTGNNIAHFRNALQSPFFVDKTHLIEVLLNEPIILVNAPHKFGKSTNMDMLRTFLQIEVNQQGEPIMNVEWDPKQKEMIEKRKLTLNYKLFKDRNLKIYQNRRFFMENCCQYGVVFIDFKLLQGNPFPQVLDQFRIVIRNAFMQHIYLLNNESIWLFCNRERFKKYIEIERNKLLTKLEIVDGFYYLTEILYTYSKRKVIVLIDDFDAPFADVIFNNNNNNFNETFEFIGHIMSYLLERNSFLRHVLINVCVHSSGAWLPNNIVFRRFLHKHPCSELYGLTEVEVKELLKKKKIIKEFADVKNWYNGYAIQDSNTLIYSTWSVLQYLQSNVYQMYLSNYNNIKNLSELLSFQSIRSSVETLLDNEIISINYQNCNKTDINILKKLLENPTDAMVAANLDLIFRFLYEHGYLVISGYIFGKTSQLKLRIPNKEMWQEIENHFYSSTFYIKHFNFNTNDIKFVINRLAVLTGNKAIQWVSAFGKQVRHMYSGDVLLPHNEYEFQATFYSFIRNVFKFVYGKSHTERGKQLRTDIIIVKADKVGIILEFILNNSSKEALKRIINKRSYQILNDVEKLDYCFYIGLNLNENRSIGISYLLDSIKMEHSISLNFSPKPK